MDQTFWIAEPDQLRAIISPHRHQIVDLLSSGGRMSIKELAYKLNCQPSRLYHHIEKLLEVGLIVPSGDRLSRRRREQLYATPSPSMRIPREIANRYPELVNEIVKSLARQMARDFEKADTHPAKLVDGEQRNLGFSRMIARPSNEQMAKINACLLELWSLMSESSEEGATPISFGWILAPLK